MPWFLNIMAEHDGLKQDGTPDKRVGTGGMFLLSTLSIRCLTVYSEFAHGKVDPHKAGAKGGNQSGDGSGETQSSSGSSGGDYKPTEHDGLRKDGEPDGRVKGN